MRTAPAQLSRLAVLALVTACQAESPTQSDPAVLEPLFHSFANSPWSAPVNLGPAVNSAANDNAPALSKDELSLYFLSDRPGGFGGNDIWVARRECVDCPWQPAVNLGPAINTVFSEAGPELSIDGHLLFVVSNRPPGAAGNANIYVSRRADPKDDFGWGPPVALGPDVNTADSEGGPEYLQSSEDGPANLYFTRGALPTFRADIYVAPIKRDGETRGPAVLVRELSAPVANDANANVRTDGREVYFWSFGPGRPDAQLGDLYVSTRRSVHDPWSTPTRLGIPQNTVFNEIGPDLSFDGRTLLFVSDRPGGFGLFDLYMSTRTPSGK
jgi:hypothetical protein